MRPRPAPWREAALTAFVVLVVAFGWGHHGDGRWALATAILLAWVGDFWVRWVRRRRLFLRLPQQRPRRHPELGEPPPAT